MFKLFGLLKVLTRIANSLEVIARIQQAWASDMGYKIAPLKPVKDPATADDVLYTDEEKDWENEVRDKLSRLHAADTEDEIGG